MGLRCSLFGHAYDEAVTERERETRGAEVVVTVREVRTCGRCGAEQVIAENTEVRHLGADDGEQPAEGEAATMTEEETPDEGVTEGPPEAEDSTGTANEADTVEAESSPEPPETEGEEPTEDISKFVEPAEPDESDLAEGTDSSITADSSKGVDSDTAADSPEEAGADTGTESEWDGPPDSAIESEDAEFIGGEDEAESTASTEEPEPTGDAGDQPADRDSGIVEPGEPGEPSSEETGEGVEKAESPTPDDEPGDERSETPEEDDEEDDAIIMDNAAGEEDRESDVGRRELAGSGNMFDTTPPEGGDGDSPGGGSGDGDRSEEPGAGSARDTPSVDSGLGSSDAGETRKDRWPGEEMEEGDDADNAESGDSTFQFGSDMHPDSEDPKGKKQPPSGLTTGGSVDVTGPTEEEPPEAVICPECGYEARAIGSSLRAGDICPECHGGYLTERR